MWTTKNALSFSVLGNHDYRGNALAQLSPVLRKIDDRFICMRSFIVNTGTKKNAIHLNLERITNLLIILQQGKQKTEMCGIIPNLVRTCGFFLCRHHSIPTGVLDSPWQASLWLERGGTSRQIHSQFAEGAHLEHIQISACKATYESKLVF
jgi:hypothetical protein